MKKIEKIIFLFAITLFLITVCIALNYAPFYVVGLNLIAIVTMVIIISRIVKRDIERKKQNAQMLAAQNEVQNNEN